MLCDVQKRLVLKFKDGFNPHFDIEIHDAVKLVYNSVSIVLSQEKNSKFTISWIFSGRRPCIRDTMCVRVGQVQCLLRHCTSVDSCLYIKTFQAV